MAAGVLSKSPVPGHDQDTQVCLQTHLCTLTHTHLDAESWGQKRATSQGLALGGRLRLASSTSRGSGGACGLRPVVCSPTRGCGTGRPGRAAVRFSVCSCKTPTTPGPKEPLDRATEFLTFPGSLLFSKSAAEIIFAPTRKFVWRKSPGHPEEEPSMARLRAELRAHVRAGVGTRGSFLETVKEV